MTTMAKIPAAASRALPLGRVLAMAVLQLALAPDAFATLTATANHDHITIDFTYRGSTVSVKGEAEAGTELVVKITSPDGHHTMMKKGKVGGFLWMNVGQLRFEQTPNYYAVYGTRSFDEIASPAERDANVIGYDALLKHVSIAPTKDEGEKATWFAEFVKHKEASRMYAAAPGAIKTRSLADGRQGYELYTKWPHQAPPGEYSVTVYALKDGKVLEQAATKVKVEQVGMVKALASMASESAAFYGIVSIAIALGAGFGVGMVVKKGGAH